MKQLIHVNDTEILLYSTPDGRVKIDVVFQDETFWMNQKKMAGLFGVKQPVISKHLKNIFESKELNKDSVYSILEYTAADGKNYKTQYYNLDAIIAVGYRVNSYQATQFRIWATQTLKEYIIKGFVMDDERLKQGKAFGKDYFDELLERIREIRASERRFYQKITDIYAQCSADYDPQSRTSQTFYATVQNKLHWAIHGHTAGELLKQRADSRKPNMGLSTWKNAPKGKILKTDVAIAKNYLSESELDELNHIVVMYLDYAELQAKKQRLMKMEDWVKKLDAFLMFNDYDILQNSGNISAKIAKQLAEKEYAIYRVKQDQHHQSDFDRLVKKAQSNKGDK
jgi:hypothetical protein